MGSRGEFAGRVFNGVRGPEGHFEFSHLSGVRCDVTGNAVELPYADYLYSMKS
jgi:hypothetical protein